MLSRCRHLVAHTSCGIHALIWSALDLIHKEVHGENIDRKRKVAGVDKTAAIVETWCRHMDAIALWHYALTLLCVWRNLGDEKQ